MGFERERELEITITTLAAALTDAREGMASGASALAETEDELTMTEALQEETLRRVEELEAAQEAFCGENSRLRWKLEQAKDKLAERETDEMALVGRLQQAIASIRENPSRPEVSEKNGCPFCGERSIDWLLAGCSEDPETEGLEDDQVRCLRCGEVFAPGFSPASCKQTGYLEDLLV